MDGSESGGVGGTRAQGSEGLEGSQIIKVDFTDNDSNFLGIEICHFVAISVKSNINFFTTTFIK